VVKYSHKEANMVEVWMVATGKTYEGLNREKLIFDNEESATKTAELINELRRKHERFLEACHTGDADWNDPNFPPAAVEMLGTKIMLSMWTIVQKFELHS
jgi:hypothetical protein